jgi:hypothetical protein
MRTIFFNCPVSNGPFTLRESPSKGVGIWIAAALNELMATPAVPHLWNTVTLAGDLRFRTEPGHAQLLRRDVEARLIAAKYGDREPSSIMTDADPAVVDTALRFVENGLVSGELSIQEETVPVCSHCGHMTGHSVSECRVCGNTATQPKTGKHLVAVYAVRRQPIHLQHTAGQVPARLLLSRTRDYGISLEPLGLAGFVLDPRAGLHATVMTAARIARAEQAVMPVTENARTNIAAYGQPFCQIDGIRLKYALHGRIPFPEIDGEPDPLAVRWFLPLVSLDFKSGITPAQLPALLLHLHRARCTAPAEPDGSALAEVRRRIAQGDMKWITNRELLSHALAYLLAAGTA